ncbi:MAG: hypothetical protein ABS75_29005 [Pelagibacterium sp. SCN 63-23]|mgnify:CR=1 FL=1|nr:MAG: hypothetical protein ABS75_29005 [Pelagibacterium sp. SCN 63-23]
MLDKNIIHYAALTDIADGIRSREISPVALTQTMLGRIESVDGPLNSYISVTAEEALAQARKAEAEIASGRYRGKLHGMPIAIKDLFYTAGTPSTFGSGAYKNYLANHTATVVQKLEAAGAVILGRLHLHEGAYGEHHADFGADPAHPWVKGYWPGGSSSGSGVATAAGLCFGSLGSDTGGSIRFPSATNGLTGLKPTWGRVSRSGVFTLADSLDTVGPMCRSAADVAAMFDVIAGFDPNDSTSLTAPVPDYSGALAGALGARGLKIGVDWRYVGEDCDPEIVAAMQAALEVLESLGAQVVPIVMPDTEAAGRLQPIMMETECANFHHDLYKADPSGFGKRLSAAIERGMSYDPVKVSQAYIERDKFKGALAQTFETVDMIISPIMTKVGVTYDDLETLLDDLGPVLRFSAPFNMSGSPALTFPVGMAKAGLPIGVQLIGAHISEATLLKAVHAYQQASDWHLKRPSL